MSMGRDWGTILRFSAAGVLVVCIFFVFAVTDPLAGSSMKSWVTLLLSCLCPGFLLIASVFYIEVEQLSWTGWALVFFFVVATNFFLYGAMAAVYVGLRKWRDRTATT